MGIHRDPFLLLLLPFPLSLFLFVFVFVFFILILFFFALHFFFDIFVLFLLCCFQEGVTYNRRKPGKVHDSEVVQSNKP